VALYKGRADAQRRKAEKALKESEESLALTLQSIGDAVIATDTDGRVIRMNPTAERLTGWTFPEAKQAMLHEVMRVENAVTRQAVENPVKRMLEGGAGPVLGQYPVLISRDGTEYRIADSAAPILDNDGKARGVIFVFSDITEKRRAEELIKNILEIVGEGFIIIDRDFRILFANRAYANAVKQPLEDIVGGHCYEISHHFIKPCFEYESSHPCTVQHVFDTGEHSAAVHTHYDKKGNPVYVETKAYPLSRDKSGMVTTAIEIVIDITDKHKLEDQLRQAQKMESIGQLAGGIAHDFNNILTAILGYGNIVLRQMAKDDPQRLNIEHMLEAGGRAAHLTKDLLLFSRKQISERKPADLNEIIRRVEKFLMRVIGEDVECVTTLAKEEMPVLGDAHQLEQVLMNLATNARDAMPTGGRFTITTERIRFDDAFITLHGYGKPGKYVMTIISDTGKGMDDVTRDHIFEPFFTTKEMGKGTGLGLAVVYGIIKQHEGFINVYSEPERGTTFKIYLPLIAGEVNAEKEALDERPAGGTETILLAEDDETVRSLIKTVLEGSGYTVITAHDGQDAVNIFKKDPGKIALLLFDIMMPRKTGKEASDEIRALQPDIKTIFSSGYAPDLIRQKVLLDDKAVVAYKPISPTELLKQVRSVLDRKNAPS
jgi:PAS domain S-box-containing protein